MYAHIYALKCYFFLIAKVKYLKTRYSYCVRYLNNIIINKDFMTWKKAGKNFYSMEVCIYIHLSILYIPSTEKEIIYVQPVFPKDH